MSLSQTCLLILLFTTVTHQTEGFCNNTRRYPKLFDTENFYECPETHSWCDVTLKLVPDDKNSECWTSLENSSKHRTQYNKTLMFRSLCIPFSSEMELHNFVVKKMNEELDCFNVTTELIDTRCMDPRMEYDYDIKPYIVVGTLYLLLLAAATCYENLVGKRHTDSLATKILCCFSVFCLNKPPKRKSRSDQRLLSMQGIRTIQTVIVIMGHIGMFFWQRNIENTDHSEFVFTRMQYVISLGLSTLQNFFMISTWLLTNKILKLYKETGKFSASHAVHKCISRYLRIWPAVIFSIFFAQPIASFYFYGPATFPIAGLTNQACSKYWWVTLIMATNWLKTDEICHLGMWYLSIDVQLQLLTIVFYYITLNNKLNIKKSLLSLFIVSCVVNVARTYYYDIHVDTYIGVKHLAKLTYFLTDGLLNSYLSFWPNVGSGIVGMFFGYVYFCSFDEIGKVEPYEKYYKFIFLVFPILGIVGPFILTNDKLITALVFPFFKPIFSFGVATGIYAMSRNVIQGPVKSLYENKYLTKLADYSYGVYIMHFLFVFTKDCTLTSTYEFTFYSMMVELSKDAVKSFLAGIVLTYAVVYPFQDLQSIVLPPLIPKKSGETAKLDVDKLKVK